MKKYSKIIGFAGCLLMFIAVFSSFVTTSVLGFNIGASFINGDGAFVLPASILAAILIFFNKPKLTLVPTVVVFLITLYDGINVLNTGSEFINLGIGFYLLIIGVVLACIYAFTFKANKKK